MIEAQQAIVTESNRVDFVLLRFDVALAHFRKLMSEALAAENSDDTRSGAQHRALAP